MQNTKINLLNYEERGIQKDSITNQFRMLVKHAKKKTLPQTVWFLRNEQSIQNL
jgi:hypothetical protein